MKNLRNLHDPVPSQMGYRRCHDMGSRVAAGLGYVRATSLDGLFQKLGGSYDFVHETFGLDDDVYVYRADKTWTVTHCHRIKLEWYVGHHNEILAEGIGHLMLHYPMVKKDYGDTAAMAISRVGLNDQEQRARREAIHFMIGFLIPDDAARAMFLTGADDTAVAKAFGVTTNLAGARRRALMRAPDDAPVPSVEERQPEPVLEPA
jgi:hypothetical protein